jgi:hypothetical protein
MRISGLARWALSNCVAVAILAACSGSQRLGHTLKVVRTGN